jgi:hypothetical protein
MERKRSFGKPLGSMEEGPRILPLLFLKSQKGRNASFIRPWRRIFGSLKSTAKLLYL